MGSGLLILLGAIGGGLLAKVAEALFNRGKTRAEAGTLEAAADKDRAEATRIITEVATDLLATVTSEAQATEARLTAKVTQLEREVHGLRSEVHALRSQIVDLGAEPVTVHGRKPPHG